MVKTKYANYRVTRLVGQGGAQCSRDLYSPSNMLTRRSLIYQRRREGQEMGGWGALVRGGMTGGRAQCARVVVGQATDLA